MVLYSFVRYCALMCGVDYYVDDKLLMHIGTFQRTSLWLPFFYFHVFTFRHLRFHQSSPCSLVTNSLVALSRGLVFCTEPFRIPFAGKLDVLCFDKTGTLTMDKMVLKGVVGSPEVGGELEEVNHSMSALLSRPNSVASTAPNSSANRNNSNVVDEVLSSTKAIITITEPSSSTCAEICISIMAACHSLLVTPETGAVVGDPLETATMDSSGFQFIRYVPSLMAVYVIRS